MRGPLFLFGASVLVVASGCTTNVGPSGTDPANPEATSSATGVVVVEGSTSNEGARTEAVARFIRARSGTVDDEALRMVGATVDFPALGTCGPVTSAKTSGASPLTLLNVGGVTLVAGEGSAALTPRQLPDVADLVSGVVYSARTDGLPSKSEYLLRIDGASEADVPSFAVSAASPGEPNDVRIAGDDGRAGAVSLVAGAAVEVTWEAGTGDDSIYMDIAGASATPLARCLFADSGRATLPAVAFGGGTVTDGTLAVHRLHRESFKAHGVDPGEVRFDFARVVPFARR